MIHIGTWLYTKFKGKLVGTDQFGNRYYQKKDNAKKRWVWYKGDAEPSKVPPAWHGWLHYTTDDIPTKHYDWQQEYVPNLTGTEYAFDPSKAAQAKATSYTPWTPS